MHPDLACVGIKSKDGSTFRALLALECRVQTLVLQHMRLSVPLYLVSKHSIKPTARIMSKDSYNLDQVVKDAQGKMQYVNLGPSGLRVSKISLGMMS